MSAHSEAKFKVGDRVRVVRIGYRVPNPSYHEADLGTVTTITAINGAEYETDSDWFFHEEDIELVAPQAGATNAIRTVTRREIVPGVYGIVETGADGSVSVYKDGAPTPDELREAAHLFAQIAEVLEGQAREAA